MPAITMIFALAASQAAAAGAPAQPAAPQSLQARFDAATAAADAGRCDEAVEAFNRLEPLGAVQKSATVSATLKLRRGACLARLGRDASADLRSGLAALEARPEFRQDIAQAHLALGRIAYLNYDYAGARARFLAAHDKLEPAERFDVLLWLVRTTMFDPGSEALGYADQAMAIASANAGTNKKLLADLKTLRARVLLNHGQVQEAYSELRQALREQGGLGLKVDISDVVTRSDLALAALLAKRPEEAREYLAYTGAGRLKSPFARAASMDLPPCGGPDGLAPDDVAVVEFGINDDGSVSYATPIYASRPGPPAIAFARAVADWSWKAEEAVKVPPLFRAVTRVELRCSTEVERPAIVRLLRDDLESWLATRTVQPFAQDRLTDAQRLAPARAELARRRGAGGGPELLPVLVALAENPVLPEEERPALFQEAGGIAAAAGAPAGARTYLAIGAGTTPENAWTMSASFRQYLRTLLARPDIAADARAASALRIMISEPGFRAPAPDDAAALLRQVAADDRLASGDPMRVGALVRLAALQARTGDLASARASYEATGLTAQQCALVDAKPAMRKTGATSGDFPLEAMRWGFEGWVRTEFDIGADGRTSAQRAVIAYPPFVFRDAAVEMARDIRFQQSYRPAGGLGCGGAQTSIHFLLPD